MEIFQLEQIPNSYGGSLSSFNEEDIFSIEKAGAQAAFYWYTQGSYEGFGQLLILKNGGWYLHACSHCSCYGPIDHLPDLESPLCNKLDELKGKCSEELWLEVEPLVSLALSKGYYDPPYNKPFSNKTNRYKSLINSK